MRFTDNLLTGTLIIRYKRFFVDVKVNNQIITAHCPNSGSMLGLLDKNNKIWISESNNPKRKLKFTLELIKVKDSLVGVNTIFANKIVFEALNNKTIKEFSKFENIKTEAVYDANTRFDFLLKIVLPPEISFLRPPNIDCKIVGTPGKQKTFSTINPGAPLEGL